MELILDKIQTTKDRDGKVISEVYSFTLPDKNIFEIGLRGADLLLPIIDKQILAASRIKASLVVTTEETINKVIIV